MIMCRELSEDEVAAIATPLWSRDGEGEWTFDTLLFAELLFEAARVQQNHSRETQNDSSAQS